jgi:phosphoribosyl 1,2-cyclic phosphodiesterase
MLNFLGTGTAFNTKAGNNSAYIKGHNKEGKTFLILIDCGEDVFKKVVEKKLYNVDNIYILITHAHSDHIGSLSSLIWYCEYVIKTVPVIVAPSDVFSILGLMGNNRESYKRYFSHEWQEEQIDIMGRFKVFPYRTEHQSGMNCFGYLIEDLQTPLKQYDSYAIYYSGDTKKLPDKIVKMFKNHEINELYTDFTFYEGEDSVHLRFSELKKTIHKRLRFKTFLMHYGDEWLELAHPKSLYGNSKLDNPFDGFMLAQITGYNK